MNRKGLLVLVCVVVVVGQLGCSYGSMMLLMGPQGSAASVSSADWWPRFHHDPENSGVSLGSAPSANRVAWKYHDADGGFTSPVVSDGRVFVGSLGSPKSQWQGKVSCFDSTSGSLVWTYKPVNASVYADPVVDSGRVYVGSGNLERLQGEMTTGLGEVSCLYASNGTRVWTYPESIYVEGCPAVVDGRLYVAGCRPSGSIVLCLDAVTGAMVWNNSLIYEYIQAPVCVSDQRVFVVSDDLVFCLNAPDGLILWHYQALGLVSAAPSVADGHVFFGSQGTNEGNGAVYCLNESDGLEIWRNNASEFKVIGHSTPAVFSGRIYIGARGQHGGLYCLDASSGAIVWSYGLKGYGSGVDCSPAVAAGKVYIGTNRLIMGGQFLCLDASSGQKVWSHLLLGRVYYSSPAIADGKVYYGINKGILRNVGTLYCFG